MYLIYSLLFSLGVILAAPYYLWRLRGRIFSGAGWRERFGFLPTNLQQEQAGAIWVHAVSVGETLAVVGLVREIRRRFPGRKVFLSHVTPAGREAGESRLPDVAGRFYLPLDGSWAVRRAIAHLRPSLLVIVETELWPNLLRRAQEAGARIVLVNARLSDRSFRRYRIIPWFMRRVLENVERICAQSEADAQRFCALGARPERVLVTGNLKFDARPPESGELARGLRQAIHLARRGPVFVAGSTMAGEEELLLPVWADIRSRHPQALWILAPRHPVRFEMVAQRLARQGRSFVRRTSLENEAERVAAQLAAAEILLLDSIGELAGAFELADVVFVGGSLVPTGGHNVLEPAFWSKPILFGPHMANFRDVADLFLRGDAALQVSEAAELAGAVNDLLGDGARRRRMGEAAKQVLEREAGATRRTFEQFSAWLEERADVRSVAS